MYSVLLGLGSNIGDRLDYLSKAIEEISAIVTVTSVSSVYETEPVHMDSVDPFLNMAIAIQTPDDPPLLLVKLKKVEKKLGRRVPVHNEPRIIDIDILLYRGFAYDDHTIRVPHPAMHHRRFVLEPLNEIVPTAVHPIFEKTIASLLRTCADRHRVVRTEYQVTHALHH
jgi:2-amino-4-hydroxy-6-hydroxymethyldihydropteridine diphosphokinase